MDANLLTRWPRSNFGEETAQRTKSVKTWVFIAMEKYRALFEEGIILVIMALFTLLKEMINQTGPIHWAKSAAKFFTNLVAGWGFYSFLLAYKPWYGEYPQKVGVIMVVVYGGSRIIDLVVDAIYKLNFKEIIRRWMGL